MCGFDFMHKVSPRFYRIKTSSFRDHPPFFLRIKNFSLFFCSFLLQLLVVRRAIGLAFMAKEPIGAEGFLTARAHPAFPVPRFLLPRLVALLYGLVALGAQQASRFHVVAEAIGLVLVRIVALIEQAIAGRAPEAIGVPLLAVGDGNFVLFDALATASAY